MRKKALSLFLAMMMLLSLVTPVSAEDGTLDVSQGSVSITENGTYTVTGTTTGNNISVAENVEATITLQDVSIQLSDGSGVSGGDHSNMDGAGTAAIALGGGSKVTLILSGSNILKSGAGRAAIEVPGSKIHVDGTPTAATPAALIMEGTGSLKATGGNSAAGIGGSFCMNAGSITINSGNITATAGGGSNGDSGAGIGGGHAGNDNTTGKAYGSFDSITINGGTITADGVRLGAGIGAGAHGKCDGAVITITGGLVTAKGGTYRGDGGDGIGLAHGGSSKTPPQVTISGNAFVVASSVNTKNASAGAAKTTYNGGIVQVNKIGTVYGDVTLAGDLTIASDITLTIPEGKTLTVPSGVILTVEGKIDGAGTVKLQGGTLVGEENVTANLNKGPHSLKLTVTPNTQSYGGDLVLTATAYHTEAQTVYTEANGTVTFYNGDTVLGTAEFDSGAATLTVSANMAAGGYMLKATAAIGEITHSATSGVDITKAAQTSVPVAPTAAEISYGSITLNANTDEGQGAVEYACVEKPSEGTAEPSSWQTGLNFSGLKQNTTYLLYARFAGNDCYLPSDCSTAAEITTMAMETMAAPVLGSEGHTVGYDSVTLQAPAVSEVYAEAIVQYRIGTADENGEVIWGDWQKKTEFTGLNELTTYYFQARYAITAYEHYSVESNIVALTTVVTPEIKVSIRVIGATQPDGAPTFNSSSYDYKGAEYQNWLKTTEYTVKLGTKYDDLVSKALTEAGFTFTLSGNRNTSITSPDGSYALTYNRTNYGSSSRWCYTRYQRGEFVEDGLYSNNELEDGDQLILHFVFNYQYELSSYARGTEDMVQNYLKVLDMSAAEAEAVNTAIARINAIGRVTPDSKAAIEAARAAYNALSEMQKAAVDNYQTLTDAEAAYAAIEAGAATRTPLPAPTVSVVEDSVGLYSVSLQAAALENVDVNCYTVMYSVSTDGQTWGAWQNSNVFEKLLPAETYYFCAIAQTNDWSLYSDSEAGTAVSAATAGGDVTAVEVATKEELAVALSGADTSGKLTVVELTQNIVINDIKQENYIVTIPNAANILLTTKNGSGLYFNECGGGSCIQVNAGTTVTVRDMTLASLNYNGFVASGNFGPGNTPGNAWHSALRMMADTAVVNLDGVTMYNDSSSKGVVQSTAKGTLNVYSGAFRGLGYNVFNLASGSTFNLIPNGDILMEGKATVETAHVIPLFGTPVSSYPAADLSSGELTYGDSLRINMHAETKVPPVALDEIVVLTADDENAANADVTYEITDDKITFTVKNRYGKDGNALVRFLRNGSSTYWRSYSDLVGEDETGLLNVFSYSGLTPDTAYTFTVQYASLDNSYTDVSKEIAITTTFTPAVLTAPTLGDQAVKTENSIELTAPDGSKQDTTAVLEYRKGVKAEDSEEITWGEWQESLVFADLAPNTTYYFQAKYRAVHKYWLDSEPSEAVSITTKAPVLTAPSVGDVEATAAAFTITLPALEKSEQDSTAVVYYRISEDGVTWGDWQVSARFTGLKANTTYYFQACYVSGTNAWADSAPSRIFTASTIANENAPMFLVEQVTGRVGDTVEVKIELNNNPGIIAATLEVEYDREKLELVGMEDGELLPNGTFPSKLEGTKPVIDFTVYPFALSWEDSTATENITANGTLATLTFKVKETCAIGDKAVISVSYDPENVYEFSMVNVAIDVSNGGIEVVDHKWNAPVYAWSDDHSTCTATRTCSDEGCEALVETETVSSTCERTEATETEDGQAVYTAVFTNLAFEKQTYTETLYAVRAAFAVSEVSGCVGDEVQVTISMMENPGIMAAVLNVDYDSEKLELIAAEDAGLLKGFVSGDNLAEDPFYLSWEGADENTTENGVIATLIFRIKDTCVVGDEAAITLSFEANEVYDADLNNVAFRVLDGIVTVADHVWGEPVYTWSKDHSACTATRACSCGESESERVVASVETVEATCEKTGLKTWTADFQEEVFETQIWQEELPTLAHNATVSGNADGTEMIFTCVDCGNVTVEPAAEDDAVVIISDATGSVGEELQLTVSVKNNPGFIAATFELGYDSNVLELVKAENMSGLKTFAVSGNTLRLGGINETADETAEGAMIRLTFQVLATCEEGTAVTLTYQPADLYNYDMEAVTFAINNGVIVAGDYQLGDVNDDGSVDIKDVTILRRHLAKWAGYEKIVKLAADVNGDGVINSKDVTILRRYLAGWEGVTLG